MATTGRALAGQGGKGAGRDRLRAKVGFGVVALGCAAMLAFGGPHARGAAQPRTDSGAAIQQAATSGSFGPIGRTGPADEYLQRAPVAAPRVSPRSGPADEYTQAETETAGPATHGAGPADEYEVP
jgi:hypothetical protein